MQDGNDNQWWLKYLEDPEFVEDNSEFSDFEESDVYPKEEWKNIIEELAPNNRCILDQYRAVPLMVMVSDPQCPEEIFEKLLKINFTQKHVGEDFYSAALQVPNISAEHIQKICAATSWGFDSTKFLSKKNCSEDVLLKISDRLKSYSNDIWDLLKHPACNEKILQNLAKNFDTYKREDVKDFFIKILNDKHCSKDLLKSMITGAFEFDGEMYQPGTIFQNILSHKKIDEDCLHLIVDFVRYTEPQERFKFCKKIVQNKFCTPKFYQDLLKKVPFTSKQANSLNKIMIDKGENIDAENLLLHLCSDKCSEKDLKKFIKIADEAVKSKDKEKIGKISEILFSQDEQDVFALDNKIMTWLFTKGNIKDLDAVNNVRRFYGLQTDIGDYWHEDSDVVDARRILFSGNLSAIGEKNPHYARKHSAEFLKYKPDYSKEYSAEDYDLSHNISLKKLAQEGVAFPLDRIKECLAEAHVPPLLVNKFNITDFSHILIENSTSYIDDEMGKQLNLSEFQSDVSLSFREQFWQKVGKNDKLVKFISQDLENKGIMPGVIDQIWENVRESGSPCHNAQGYRNVFGVSLQLHHGKALKDGGKNKDDNIIIVVSIDGEKTILNDFDEERTRNIGLKDLNSHLPFHEFDNPLVNIYVDEKGNFSNKLLEKGKRIGVFTTPLPLGISGQSVLYYGGPNARSCCVGSVNGKVFDVDYDVTKKYSTIKNSKIPLKGIEHENF